MSEVGIGQTLVQDISANFVVIQFISLIACASIAFIGAVLAARAGAMLAEARLLYAAIDAEAKKEKSQKKTSAMQSEKMQERLSSVARNRPLDIKRRIV